MECGLALQEVKASLVDVGAQVGNEGEEGGAGVERSVRGNALFVVKNAEVEVRRVDLFRRRKAELGFFYCFIPRILFWARLKSRLSTLCFYVLKGNDRSCTS